MSETPSSPPPSSEPLTVEDLQVGMAMELVADVLDADDEHTYVVWKWRPAATTTGDDAAGAN